MKFAQYFNHLIERSSLSKTEIADKANVSVQYVVNLTKGHSNAPTSDRCQQFALILNLDEAEKNKLFQLAYDERQKDGDLAFQGVIKDNKVGDYKKSENIEKEINRKECISDLMQWAQKSKLSKLKALIELLKNGED